MRRKSVAISKWDIPTVKTVASAIHGQMRSKGIKGPGKRRFLDIVAGGLGYESFSAVEVRSKGVKTKHRRFPYTLVEASASLIDEIVSRVPEIDEEFANELPNLIRTAAGLSPELVHHLTFHVSDKYFWDSEHGFCYTERPIDHECLDASNAMELGQVSLIAEGLPWAFCDFPAWFDEFNLADFLIYGWSKDYEGQLFGIPDRLVVRRELADVVTELEGFCDRIGVTLDVVDESDVVHQQIRRYCAKTVNHKLGWALGHREFDEIGPLYSYGQDHHFYLDHTYSATEIVRLELLGERRSQDYETMRNKWDDFLVIEDEASHMSGPFAEYARFHHSQKALKDTLLFQSPVGGAQVVGAKYLIECITNYPAGSNIDQVSGLIGLQETVLRSWPGQLEDLEKQQGVILQEGLSKNLLWLFNAWYFGLFRASRRPERFRFREGRAFVIRDARDIVRLAGWAINSDGEGVLLELGDAESADNGVWLALFPSNWLSGNEMYFRVDRDILDPWREEAMLPRWLYWGHHNIDTSDAIEALDKGMTKEAQYGCSFRLWWDLAYWNEPLMELHKEFEEYFVGESVSDGLEYSARERILGTITRQTRLLHEWIPWPINKTIARDIVCELWEFKSYMHLLETLDLVEPEKDPRLVRLASKNTDSKYREEMENVLLNISIEISQKNPFSSRLRREGAHMVVRAMLELEPGKGLLVKTETGDWIYQAPNGWRDAEEIMDDWAQASNWEEHLSILDELMNRYPTHPRIPASAAWIHKDQGNLRKADELSKRAYDLCLAAAPDGFALDKEEVNWGFVQNRGFHRAIYTRGVVLEDMGHDEEASELYRCLLLMNPSDNMGVRGHDLVSNDVLEEARRREKEYREREEARMAAMNNMSVEEFRDVVGLAEQQLRNQQHLH